MDDGACQAARSAPRRPRLRDRRPASAGAETPDRGPARLVVLTLLFACWLAGAPEPARAEPPRVPAPETRRAIEQEERRRPLEQLTVPVGPAQLTIGGQVGLKTRSELNFDLDDQTRTDRIFLTLSSELEGDLRLGSQLELFGELKFENRNVLLDEARDEDMLARFRMGENWVFLKGLFGGSLSVKVGRQDFDDVREWLYDKDLDAVRLFFDRERLGLELAVTQQLVAPEPGEREVTNYIAYGSYRLARRAFADAYVFVRDDRSPRHETDDRDDSDPVWFGLRSYGRRILGALDYWLDAAYLTGRSVDVRFRRGRFETTTRELRAWAVDVGATYVFRGPALEPSVTAGVAFGSGDSDPGDRTDTQFRQTGLQDNEARFNGVKNFRYYGELLDPELSNLLIVTAGAGIRPTARSSIDLVAHHYRQDEPAPSIRRSRLDVRAGQHRQVGHEVDLIVGWLVDARFDLKIAVAGFFPGKAFTSPATDPAVFANVELTLNF